MVMDINISIWLWRFCERFLSWPVSPRSDRSVSPFVGCALWRLALRFHVRFHDCRRGEEGVQRKSLFFKASVSVSTCRRHTQKSTAVVVVVVIVDVWCSFFSS